jgi:hypothetical protein
VTVSVKPLPAAVSSLYLAQVAAASTGEAAKSKDPIPVKSVDLPFGTAHSFTFLVQMGFDLSNIKRTAVDANTIRIEASALGLTPKMHMVMVMTAREGRSCAVAFCYREGDSLAAQVAQKAFKSLK